jgi:putative aldouronate transport system substrate-binding protein
MGTNKLKINKEEIEMGRKIFAILVVVIMLTSMFGCSTAKKTTQPPQEAQPTTAPVEPTKAPEPTQAPAPTDTSVPTTPPVMLDYYIVGNSDSPERAAVENAIDAYIEPLINADITFHIIGWGDWASKAVTALEAGEKIDIFFTADWYYYMQLVGEGLLTPLNDDNGPNGNLLEQYGQGILTSLNTAFITGSQVDGVSYAIPTNKELSVPWGFVYNATIADEIGFTDADAAAVKTMKDLEPWLEKAKNAYPDIYPYLTDGTIGFMPWIHAFATNINDYVVNMSAIPDASGKVDETIMVPFETDWMKDYLNIVRDWYTKGYINPDAGLSTFDTSQDMNAGKFFIEPMPLKGNNIKAQELVIASGNPDLQLKEIYGMPKVINTSDCGGSMLAIPMSSDHPVEAMKLINLMHTDRKLINMMLYGVEGTNWTLEPDGRVNIIDDGWIQYHPGAWVWGDITLQYVTTKEDPNKNKLLIDYAQDAFPEPSLGFRFRPEPVAAEMTALSAVVDGSSRALLTGYVDPTTELPKFIQAMKDAGLDTVLAEVQKQYDEWKAAAGK